MRRVMKYREGLRMDLLVELAAVVILLMSIGAAPLPGQQKGQKIFSSPEDASKALHRAAKANDEKAILELLGPYGKEVASSGDEAEDAESRAYFAKRYDEMHRLVKEPDGSVTLYVGARNWPYPIPLVNKGNAWYFDTAAGEKEIVLRRIGRNEISAIHICEQLAAAQNEYYAQHKEYAQKVFSEEGKHNGLYWKAENGEPQSPIGPRVAWAFADESRKSGGGEGVPYRGYYFHLLTGQGKNAAGGTKSYLVDGKMTGGFAFVAYPADYRSSGVKTFVVSADGVLYEKDLGKKTGTIAKAMTQFNPDAAWHKTDQGEQQAASGKPSS